MMENEKIRCGDPVLHSARAHPTNFTRDGINLVGKPARPSRVIAPIEKQRKGDESQSKKVSKTSPAMICHGFRGHREKLGGVVVD